MTEPTSGLSERVLAGGRRRLDRAARRRARRVADRSGRDPVIVYSLPKTASSTAARSFLHPRVGRPVHQVHLLSDDRHQRLADAAERGVRLPSEHKQRVMADARAAIDDPTRRPAVLTITRLPLTRAVSWFFQSWRTDFPWIADPAVVGIDRVDELVELFHVRLPVALDATEGWFGAELTPVTGYDPYAEPFPRSAGWQLRSLAGCDLAVARAEDLDACFGDLSQALVGHRLRLRAANRAAAKSYADLYQAFLGRLALTGDELDALRESRYARHFYSGGEIEAGLGPYLPAGRSRR